MTKCIIGYDLNETGCQVSYYSEEQKEPQTMEVASDHYRIPLMIGRNQNLWVIGQEARRMEVTGEGSVATDLYRKTLEQKKIRLGEKEYEAVWLLGKFIEMSLERFVKIEQLVFAVPKMNIDVAGILKGIGQRLGVSKQNVYVQDYKESFCNYMFYQPKELWQYEAALFHCDRKEVRAYMLKRLNTGFGKGRDRFVTVDEVASEQMAELDAVYPVLNVDRAKEADVLFKQFVQQVFDKKLVSSVFLVGEGFEHTWYPQASKVLCNGRRAFIGNNLYSKGACYTAYRRTLPDVEGPTYLDETKMTEQICLKMRVRGKDCWYPIVPWGVRWYEADMQCEVLLEDLEDIEIHVESLTGKHMRVETVSVASLPKRRPYTTRLQIRVLFLEEEICQIRFQDVGFGEFYEPTGFLVEKEIRLGGNDGQFNSLS